MSFANLLLCHFLLNPFKLFIYFLTKCLTFFFFSFILPVNVLSFLFFFVFLGMSCFPCSVFNFVCISIMVLFSFLKKFQFFPDFCWLMLQILVYNISHELLHICFIVCMCVCLLHYVLKNSWQSTQSFFFFFGICSLEDWSGKWLPTLVFLPEKLHGHRSLAGYSLWGHRKSDTTEHTCRCVAGTQDCPLLLFFLFFPLFSL